MPKNKNPLDLDKESLNSENVIKKDEPKIEDSQKDDAQKEDVKKEEPQKEEPRKKDAQENEEHKPKIYPKLFSIRIININKENSNLMKKVSSFILRKIIFK